MSKILDSSLNQSPCIKSIHRIALIDQSGSMGNNINKVIDQVKQTLSLLNNDDIYSIIGFSSQSECTVYLKGVRKSDDINLILDTMRRTFSTTCFSAPISRAVEIAKDLEVITPFVEIDLFTDGQPVVLWSNEVELNKVLDSIKLLNKNLLSINTIGYGYYDRDFLTKISDASQYGAFTHSSNIEEFFNIIKQNYKISGKVIDTPIRISSYGGNEILVTTNSFSKYSTKELDIRYSDDNFKVFVIQNDTSTIGINNSIIDFNDTTKTSDEDKTNMLYAYAYQLYYNGQRQKSLDIIVNNLHDKYLADLMISAFTNKEVESVQETLRVASIDESTRYLAGKCAVGFLPKRDAFCFFDLLYILQSTSCKYLPFSKNVDQYKRIGKKTVDNFNLFTKSDEEVIASFDLVVWNKDSMNLSLKFDINGTVELNPRSSSAVGLSSVVNAKIFRNHTFIKDGEYNMDAIEVLLTPAAVIKFEGKSNIIDSDDVKIIDGITYVKTIITFNNLPIINRNYINNSNSIDDLFEVVHSIITTEAKNKVLGYFIDQVKDELPISKTKSGSFKKLTVDQIRVLEEHGIDKSFNYRGIDNVQASKDDCDSYQSREVSFSLKGCSAIPKVDEVLTKAAAGKKINYLGTVMYDYYTSLSNIVDFNIKTPTLLKFLVTEKNFFNKYLAENRNKLAANRLAKVLTNDWYAGMIQDTDGNYTYEKEDQVMIIKTKYVTKYFD